MSDNWVVQNLQNALETWNEKLAEIWTLVTQSPQSFKGGSIWNVMVGIHGAVQAVGLALVVLFFVMGVMKTCGSFADLKRPEVAIKVFVRFAIAKAAVTYGLELMNALFSIAQGLVSTIMSAAGFGSVQTAVLPTEIITAVEDCGFFESIPLWAVTLIGGLLITVLSFVMIMTVYGRFFKLYLYTAIAPVPLIVNTPSLSSVQVTFPPFFPQLPLATTVTPQACTGSSDAASMEANPAPALTPMTFGLAIALLSTDWMSTPAVPSAAPASNAETVRGRRT